MKKDMNQITSDRLHAVWDQLSERAKEVIADTSYQILDDLFGGLETAEEVNAFILENYPEED